MVRADPTVSSEGGYAPLPIPPPNGHCAGKARARKWISSHADSRGLNVAFVTGSYSERVPAAARLGGDAGSAGQLDQLASQRLPAGDQPAPQVAVEEEREEAARVAPGQGEALLPCESEEAGGQERDAEHRQRPAAAELPRRHGLGDPAHRVEHRAGEDLVCRLLLVARRERP